MHDRYDSLRISHSILRLNEPTIPSTISSAPFFLCVNICNRHWLFHAVVLSTSGIRLCLAKRATFPFFFSNWINMLTCMLGFTPNYHLINDQVPPENRFAWLGKNRVLQNEPIRAWIATTLILSLACDWALERRARFRHEHRELFQKTIPVRQLYCQDFIAWQ